MLRDQSGDLLRSSECPSFAGEFPAIARSIPRIRSAIVEWARQAGAGGRVVEAIALAVSEAVTNVVVHAYAGATEPGSVLVRASRDHDEIGVTIADRGCGMRPRHDSPGLGLGMPLMATLASSFDVEQEGDGTNLRMHFALGTDGR